MRASVGLAFNSIIRSGTLVFCQERGMEFKNVFVPLFALMVLKNSEALYLSTRNFIIKLLSYQFIHMCEPKTKGCNGGSSCDKHKECLQLM